MYRKTFVWLYRQTISRMYTIFNTVYAISDTNKIYQFQDIWRIFTRVRDEQTDIQTDRQTNRMHTHFSTLLESVKKKLMFCFRTYIMQGKYSNHGKKMKLRFLQIIYTFYGFLNFYSLCCFDGEVSMCVSLCVYVCMDACVCE